MRACCEDPRRERVAPSFRSPSIPSWVHPTRVRVPALRPQSPLPSPPPHLSPVAMGAAGSQILPFDPNLSRFPEKALGFRSCPSLSRLASLASTPPLARGWQPSDHPRLLGCTDRAVRVVTRRARRKTVWTAEVWTLRADHPPGAFRDSCLSPH